jgi:hypothetical protein
MLCSSPMSVSSERNGGSVALAGRPSEVRAAAATNRPAWAISTASPSVLSSTVLPPALGPVRTSSGASASSSTSLGTQFSISGWRAPGSRTAAPSATSGRTSAQSRASRAEATTRSSSVSAASVGSRPGSNASRWPSAIRMRRTSSRSSNSSSVSSLLSGTTAAGSTNTVAPESEVSSTSPGTRDCEEALMGMT